MNVIQAMNIALKASIASIHTVHTTVRAKKDLLSLPTRISA